MSVQIDTFNGVPLRLTTFQDAVAEFLGRAGPESYRLVNAYSLSLASASSDYQDLLCGPGVNLPDGKPLAAALRKFSQTEAEQVRGPSFFEACLDQGRVRGVRHCFVGTTEPTLALLASELRRRFPGVEIVGAFSPPFRPMTDDERDELYGAIKAARPDVLWVGLGTPKQDFEARRLADELNIKTAAVGAAFDFSAGSKRKAPEMLHRWGLEWLFRLVNEPRRLGKRYLLGNTVFLRLLVSEWRRRR